MVYVKINQLVHDLIMLSECKLGQIGCTLKCSFQIISFTDLTSVIAQIRLIYDENMKLEEKTEKAQKQIDEYNRLSIKTMKDLGNKIETVILDQHYCNSHFDKNELALDVIAKHEANTKKNLKALDDKFKETPA